MEFREFGDTWATDKGFRRYVRASWESVSGSLDVDAGASVWGFVTATLAATGNGSTLTLSHVHLSGVWRCP